MPPVLHLFTRVFRLWWQEEDRSLLNTYRNCGRFLILHTGQALALVMLSSAMAAISLVTTLPFTLALMCWLALLGITAVQSSLTLQEERPGG